VSRQPIRKLTSRDADPPCQAFFLKTSSGHFSTPESHAAAQMVIFRQMKRNLRRRKAILRRRKASLRRRMPILRRRKAFVQRRMAILRRRTAPLPRRKAFVQRRMAILRRMKDILRRTTGILRPVKGVVQLKVLALVPTLQLWNERNSASERGNSGLAPRAHSARGAAAVRKRARHNRRFGGRRPRAEAPASARTCLRSSASTGGPGGTLRARALTKRSFADKARSQAGAWERGKKDSSS